MHPTEIIELMIFVSITTVIVIFSLFLKGKWRKIGWSLALVTLVIYLMFYVARPIWIDVQIDKKVSLLKPYLEQHYPKEEWVITTVPHRQEGFKHLNPYYIGVVFENEPDVTYYYWVESENEIYQKANSQKEAYRELKHSK